MNQPRLPHALFYPFHLCHPETLARLLTRFASIHFRDFMALQLTPMSGMTAFQDRMGMNFPGLIESGRLVQGYGVSGPIPPTVAAAIDRDLHDPHWRSLFHHALCRDRRFQRGLFEPSHSLRIGGSLVPGPAAFLRLMDDSFRQQTYDLRLVRALSKSCITLDEGYLFEYGLALVKTSASLIYTQTLARTYQIQPATDSLVHFALYARSCLRENWPKTNHLLLRTGY
ncbi:MAG: hypothetical protein CAF45_012190 [Nitrospira sp. CG24E]|nr:MAG: hypothetical protein CAF45_012190 [Nitrospira sp. CG24E]